MCVILAGMSVLSFAACGKENPNGDPNANRIIPSGHKELNIGVPDAATKTVIGLGTEADPHFFSQNVGLAGVRQVGGQSVQWTAKAEDWDDIFVQRMKDMRLERMRTMLLPSWYVSQQSYYPDNYQWESENMKSLYRQLETCQELGISVNITMWGVDWSNCLWLSEDSPQSWCVPPKQEREQDFCNAFADCIKYLIETKGFTCVNEVTLFNEPNSIYNVQYGSVNGNKYYVQLVKKLHEAFKAKGIRDKVVFNMSDDACDPVWLGKTLAALCGEDGTSEYMELCNSHTYDFGQTQTNSTMLEGLPGRSMKAYRDIFSNYKIPHIWGEFGTNTNIGSHVQTDNLSPSRGIDIARIALNSFNSDVQGMSYWVLFSQYYNRSDFQSNYIMNMGLWGFADEGYECRPVYYAYSMLTRFIRSGSQIFKINANDEQLVAAAFRTADGKWSYLAANADTVSRKISFLNETKFPSSLKKYVYNESAVPDDNRVIASSETVAANGRVLSDTVGPRSFVVYSEL